MEDDLGKLLDGSYEFKVIIEGRFDQLEILVQDGFKELKLG